MLWPNDPEGLFSTLTAFINTFAGLCFSLLMRKNTQRKGSNSDLVKYWLGLAGILAVLGGALVAFEPVCKKRWSASFAFFTSSLSGGALCLCFYLVDILNKPLIKEKLCLPFLWLGMNPLFIFVAMIFFDNILMNNIQWKSDPALATNDVSVWSFLNDEALNSWIHNQYVSSLIFSALNLALWLAVAYILYRKKIFIKL